MATYGGVNIFGRSPSISHEVNPTAQQINEFFGVEGMQSLYGGGRGRVFFAEGVLVGANLSTLNAAEAAFYAYKDGIARVLVDTRGRTWPYVLLENFKPDQKVRLDPTYIYWVSYKAVFRGLL